MIVLPATAVPVCGQAQRILPLSRKYAVLAVLSKAVR